MDETLYKTLNWPEIEAIVYSEHDNPHNILGPHLTEYGMQINAFLPGVSEVLVKDTGTGKLYSMECVDEAGFYSCLISKKHIQYVLVITYPDNHTLECYDSYAFAPFIKDKELEDFNKGIHYEIYKRLGAHCVQHKNTNGVLFAVWAPNAVRVSVVGNFNQWDGRKHPMRRLGGSGVFELFIPGLSEGEVYKYELKVKGNLTYCKADPYANRAELRPANASVVADISGFGWKDEEWLRQRRKTDLDESPMFVYEVHLGSYKKPEESENSFYNYRELAVMIAEHMKKAGYTHVELMPVMEHPFDGSWGYQTTGYYAPTARYGSPEDFMYFVDYMHRQGYGVLLDWVPAHFPRDTFGLATFDGTCLYEHQDKRKGEHPHWGTLIYNYGRPEVKNFLIANALFWVLQYHIDGIRMDAVASMLYLDYGRGNGEWVANQFGGNENLEAVEFLKHLNSIFKKHADHAVVIAEESTAWPQVTGALDQGGLGFDYKWNMGWMNDFTEYLKQDPLFRKGCHGALTFSMVYAYSERFILSFSHDEVVHLKCSMINKMPGTKEQKFANLRIAYGYLMTHPGKKLLFMGQDFAQEREWSEARSLDWELMNKEDHKRFFYYVGELSSFYKKNPALYKEDFDPSGFEWISCLDADHSIIAFLRKSKKDAQTLLTICNFTPVSYQEFQFGVPYKGRYKEVFNSDHEKFGGSGVTNPRQKNAKKEACDGREYSIKVQVPPLGIAVFSCIQDK